MPEDREQQRVPQPSRIGAGVRGIGPRIGADLRAGVAAALLAGALLCLLPTSVASAAFPGSNGLIAFVRHHAIYTISDAGANPQRLTHARRCSGPRWSPNGERIAYVCNGDLWVMHANGSHKRQLTSQAPRYSDARPSWSPNGKYLAFVKTERHHRYGYLTRYDMATHHEVTFSVPYHSERHTARQIKVRALPDPVAWAWALTGSQHGSFILVEGAGGSPFCQSGYWCLDALGAPRQSQYRNEFPSAEDLTPKPTRLADPDWFPYSPQFATDALTTQERCSSGACAPQGIDLEVGDNPGYAGAYQAVWAPSGGEIAYVQTLDGVPTIYVSSTNPDVGEGPVRVTIGTQPDWQPLHYNSNSRLRGGR